MIGEILWPLAFGFFVWSLNEAHKRYEARRAQIWLDMADLKGELDFHTAQIKSILENSVEVFKKSDELKKFLSDQQMAKAFTPRGMR